jgi:hypothetical protein
MTRAGIQVFNDSGVLQIDDSWRVPTLQAGLGGAIPGGPDPKLISFTGRTRPILVWQGLNGRPTTFIDHVNISGGAYDYYFNTRGLGGGDNFVLFDVPEPFPAHGVGLLIWDADGNEAFDSNQGYMNVISKHDWVPGSSPPPGRGGGGVSTGISRPTGSNLWFAVTTQSFFVDSGYPVAGQYTIGSYGFRWTGDDLYAYRDDYAQPFGSPASSNKTVTILLVDVTRML